MRYIDDRSAHYLYRASVHTERETC